MRFAKGGVLLVCLLAGCGRAEKRSSGPGTTVKRPGEPDLVRVKDDDGAMNSAMTNARQTLPSFLQALKDPKPNQKGFTIKRGFEEGGPKEHIWVAEVTYDGKVFHGKLANVPVDIKRLKLGDPVTVTPDELSDWMYMEDGKIVGGYTVRVLYGRASPAEKKEMGALSFKD
jgi:uncharacterized protein YegJ (DUF2314 family)